MRGATLVDLEKAGQGRRDLGGILPACDESAGHERRYSIANHALDLRRCQWRPTELAQQFVYCRVQVWQGVDQCTVKIEDQKEAVHRCSLRRRIRLCNLIAMLRKP